MATLTWRFNKKAAEYEARTVFCRYHIEAANFTTEFQDQCETDFLRNVDAIATANGYIKANPDKVQISRKTAEHMAELLQLEIEDNNGTCDDCNAASEELTAALTEADR